MMRGLAGNPTTCSASVMQAGRPITRDDVVEGAEGIGLLAGDNVQATYSFPNGVFGFFYRAAEKPVSRVVLLCRFSVLPGH